MKRRKLGGFLIEAAYVSAFTLALHFALQERWDAAGLAVTVGVIGKTTDFISERLSIGFYKN